MDFNAANERLIRQTGEVLAPLFMKDMEEGAGRVGRIFEKSVDKAWVKAFTDRLMLGFTEEELEKCGRNPAFIVALAKLMQESLVRFNNGG